MSKVIKERKRIKLVEYYRVYRTGNYHEGDVRILECNKAGHVTADRKGLRAYYENDPGWYFDGVQPSVRHYWQPGVIKCDCGRKFDYDDAWLNTCPYCGADYNGQGVRLAPRSQWGEDTGESIADVTTGVYNDRW